MWGGKAIKPDGRQRALLAESIGFADANGAGLPPELFECLRHFFERDAIRLRAMRDRARFVAIPGFRSRIELNAAALGLETIYDWRAALSASPEDRRASIMAKARQQWLFLATVLVHEGTHALNGVTLFGRRDDERAAYGAELKFLHNVLGSECELLVKNAARSLRGDALRDARDIEGLSFKI